MHIPPILIAIILFMLAAYLGWRDLRLAVYLLVITLPLNNRILFTLGVPQLLPVRVVIYAVILVMFGKLYERFAESEKKGLKNYLNSLRSAILEATKDPIFFVLLLLLLVRILSLYNSKNLSGSLSLLLFYFSMLFLYLYLKVLTNRFGYQFLRKLFSLYVFVAVASGLFSLVQVFYLWRYDRILPGVWPTEGEPTRFGATFWDINHYAPYLTSVIPVLALKGLFPKSWRWGIFYWLSFFFGIVVSGMTLSRSGWLGLGAALFMVIPILMAKKLFKETAAYLFVLQSLILIVVVGVIIYKIPVADRLYSLTRKVHSDSVIAHALLIKGNIAIFEKYPVLGGGYGGFNEHFRETKFAAKYFDYDPVKGKKVPAHSLILEPLSETGILGFTLYSVLLFLIFKNLISAIKNTRDRDLLVSCVGLLAALVGILFSGIFYSYNLEFYWFLLFFAVFLARPAVKEETMNRKDFLVVLALLGLAAFFIFPNLGKIALIDWDESIYAEVSRNVLFYKDFVTLRWRRDVFWFEKPPLYFWLTSLLYYAYEVSEFAARFWSAIAGVFGIVATYFLGKKLFNRVTGIVSALTLLSTVHWIFQSRNGTLDVFVATTTALSLYFFYKARTQPKNWLWVGVFLGLTFMTKSVVVTVPIATMISFAIFEIIVYSRRSFYFNRQMLKAIFIFLLIVFPWHLASFIRHGRNFVDSYFFYHVLERTQGIEGHESDIFWYLIVLKVWMRHNFVILLPAFFYLIFNLYKTLKNRVDSSEKLGEIFLIIWAVATFIIFSLSTSKIQWYIMPIYPALSLIIGRFLTRLFRGKFTFGLILVMLISVPIVYDRYRPLWDIEDYNRDIAETARYMKVLTGDDRGVPVLAVNLAPGPVMFYSERPVITTILEEVLGEVEFNETFYALGELGDMERIEEEFPNRGVVIFKQAGDFILYGRKSEWFSQ